MREFLKTKLGTVVLSFLFVLVLFVTAKLLWQKHQIDKQIAALSARADKIKGENEQLTDLIKYLNTPDYEEKIAREKLNLKKDGEVVVGLPQNQQEQVASASTNADQMSNAKKWYYYFFKNETN